jgi:hypothetical protein
MRENRLRGRSPRSVVLGAAEPVFEFDPGEPVVGLRIVAMSTRVRLLIYPCSVPAGDRAHVTGCEGRN